MSRAQELFEQGLAAEKEEQLSLARQRYEECLAQGGDSRAIVWLRYAHVLEEQKEYRAAAEAAERALALSDKPPLRRDAYTILGLCYSALGEHKLAEGVYRQALALEPSPVTCLLLAWALDQQGRGTEALRCLKKALRIDPSYDEAHYNLGWYYKQSGRYVLAERHLRQALASDPDYFSAHLELGQLLLRSRRRKDLLEAKEHLSRAVELEPSDIWAAVYLANSLWRLGEIEAAEEQYERVLARWPEQSLPHWCYGDFLADTGRNRDLAEEILEKAVRLAPDDEQAHAFLGKHLLGWGQRDRARAALERASQLGNQKARKLLEQLKRAR